MTKVKICGLSRAQDIEAVNRVLPDYAGFVFADSRRQVDIGTAAKLKNKLDTRIMAVGVFVNAELESVCQIYRAGIVDLIQLHGDEDDSYIRRLKEACVCGVIKAVGIGTQLPALPNGQDYLLFDTLSVSRGGTGRVFNWSLLDNFRGQPYFLAGGLSAAVAADAVRQLSPYCLDVSSGVETEGIKDEYKIEEFVRLVREQSG